jgi:hypothetical protein
MNRCQKCGYLHDQYAQCLSCAEVTEVPIGRPRSQSGPVIYETQEELNAALAVWQKRLRLQDWDVRAEIKKGDDMGGDATGRIIVWFDQKSAWIRLMRHTDWPGNNCSLWPPDMEQTLVHEMLHIPCKPFEPVDQDSKEFALLEQHIEVQANCLVALVRGQ